MLPYYIEGTIKKEEEKKACVTFSVWEIFKDWIDHERKMVERFKGRLPGFKIRIFLRVSLLIFLTLER